MELLGRQEGRTRKRGSLLSLARSPRCRINRTEEGAAGGGAGGLWSQTLPRLLLGPPASQSLAVFLGRLGFGPACCFWKSDRLWAISAALSLPLGRGRCLDSVCAPARGRNPSKACGDFLL